MKHTLKDSKGFSLIELMVVVAIIGILSAISFYQYNKFKTNAFFAKMEGQAKDADLTVNRFFADVNAYPGDPAPVVCDNRGSQTSMMCDLGNGIRFNVDAGLGVEIRGNTAADTYTVMVSSVSLAGRGVWITGPDNSKTLHCNLADVRNCTEAPPF